MLRFERSGFLASVHAAFAAGWAEGKGVEGAADAVDWCHKAIAVHGGETFFVAGLHRAAVVAGNGADQERMP